MIRSSPAKLLFYILYLQLHKWKCAATRNF